MKEIESTVQDWEDQNVTKILLITINRTQTHTNEEERTETKGTQTTNGWRNWLQPPDIPDEENKNNEIVATWPPVPENQPGPRKTLQNHIIIEWSHTINGETKTEYQRDTTMNKEIEKMFKKVN
jgi:hypothetical protein